MSSDYDAIRREIDALPDPMKIPCTHNERELIGLIWRFVKLVEVERDAAEPFDHSRPLGDIPEHGDNEIEHLQQGDLLIAINSIRPAPASWAGRAWVAGARWAFERLAQVIPGDWVLVPRKATVAMQAAAGSLTPMPGALWEKMVAAAPNFGKKLNV